MRIHWARLSFCVLESLAGVMQILNGTGSPGGGLEGSYVESPFPGSCAYRGAVGDSLDGLRELEIGPWLHLKACNEYLDNGIKRS
jgi:hypothetical protein